MPFRSETYRVLIASPSDLEEERRAATEAINEWNAQHAAAAAVILLPIKWETHALPEAGVRPQDAINRQLVKMSDLLIGMFWTRLGTNTGIAEFGNGGGNRPVRIRREACDALLFKQTRESEHD